MSVPFMTWRYVPVLAVVLLTAQLVMLSQVTGLVDLSGINYDAVQYEGIVRALRHGAAAAPQAPFVYRILPATLVAASGLDPSIGFFALDVAALLGTGLLLLVLVRPHTTPAGALAAVLLWGLLPYGLRYSLHYPVLTDYLGTFLLTAVVLALLHQRHLLFALFLVAAVLTRENLIVCAPLMLLRATRPTFGRGAMPATLAALPAFVALVAVHVWPPVAPAAGAGTFEWVAFQISELLTNDRGEVWRVLAAPFFAFGMLVGPLLSTRALSIVRGEAGLTYLLAAAAITAALGGGDHDRYLFAIAPLIVWIAVRSLPSVRRTELLMLFVPLQVVCGRVLMPLGRDWGTHAAFGISLVPLDGLAVWSAVIAGGCVIVAMLRAASRRPLLADLASP
jgi:hypothetical protein